MKTDALMQQGGTGAVSARTILDMGLLFSFWCLCMAIVNPFGNFPLMDDWAYGLTVKHLIDTGEYRPQGVALAPILSNVLWGAFFSLPTGFSFTALRLSTLTASLIGCTGMYVLILTSATRRRYALMGGLLLASSPIYLPSSFTFDTDILFTAISIWSMVFFVRDIRHQSFIHYIFGTTLALAATLSRQVALCVPLAFCVTVVLKNRITLGVLIRAACPVVVCAAGYLVLRSWLLLSNKTQAALDWNTHQIINTLTHVGALSTVPLSNLFVCLTYIGLLTLPLLLLRATELLSYQNLRHLATVSTVALILLVAGASARLGYTGPTPHNRPLLMPMLIGWLRPHGIGLIVNVPGGGLLINDPPSQFAPHVGGLEPGATPFLTGSWILITIVGSIAALLLIVRVCVKLPDSIRSMRESPTDCADSAFVYLLFCGVIYLLPFIFIGDLYDPYLIPAEAMFTAALAAIPETSSVAPRPNSARFRFAAAVLVVVVGFFSIAGTHDFMALNRVHWRALQDLVHVDHISPADINGGRPFNGLTSYDPHRREIWDPWNPTQSRLWSMWARDRSLYIVGFKSVPNYMVIKEYTVWNWLSPHELRVMVLRRSWVASAPEIATSPGSSPQSSGN